MIAVSINHSQSTYTHTLSRVHERVSALSTFCVAFVMPLVYVWLLIQSSGTNCYNIQPLFSTLFSRKSTSVYYSNNNIQIKRSEQYVIEYRPFRWFVPRPHSTHTVKMRNTRRNVEEKQLKTTWIFCQSRRLNCAVADGSSSDGGDGRCCVVYGLWNVERDYCFFSSLLCLLHSFSLCRYVHCILYK